MNRMNDLLKMTARGEKILILNFPVGDPKMGDPAAMAKTYVENGCHVLEAMLPYEDPVLDGGTVRASMARALEVTDLEGAFGILKTVREACPKAVLQVMTYLGNVKKYGFDGFAAKCAAAGVDGALIPDASPEELLALDKAFGAYDIRNLRFAPYRLTDEVIASMKDLDCGYIFQQAADGGTGKRDSVSPQIGINYKLWKDAGVKAPVCAGFGISNAAQAAEAVRLGCDGIIVGSAMIDHLDTGDTAEYIASLAEALK